MKFPTACLFAVLAASPNTSHGLVTRTRTTTSYSSSRPTCRRHSPLDHHTTTRLVVAAAVVTASEQSQLAQLAGMTTLSIDSGDLKVIEDYAKTGYITDATTNPLFVSQAGLSGDPTYADVRSCFLCFVTLFCLLGSLGIVSVFLRGLNGWAIVMFFCKNPDI